MVYIKILNKNERIKIEAADSLPNSREVILPHYLLGNICLMPMAKHMMARQHPDPIQMSVLLNKWYGRTTSTYSEGIYSFVRKGYNKRTPGLPYYQYIKGEIDSLLANTVFSEEYLPLARLAKTMWEEGYSHYKNTYFWSYHLLHGDLHTGNIVSFLGKYRLIDFENLRSGPKEIELSFYLCWDYLQWENYDKSLQELVNEANLFFEKKVINEFERDRILFCLIPMWMLILITYLNNGNLLYAEERKKASSYIIPLYYKEVFSHNPWGKVVEIND